MTAEKKVTRFESLEPLSRRGDIFPKFLFIPIHFDDFIADVLD
jgi:hypothetical protein